ncbi:MAG: hypothetical protein GY869_12165, partial [Planctomycetes bacterium]|nr:hypothetical protein [Planctomycetota bacterium]
TTMKNLQNLLTLAGLIFILSFGSLEAATLSFNPASTSIDTSESVNIDVVLSDVTDFGAYETRITFDQTIVNVDNVAFGTFIGSTGRTPFAVDQTIDNVAGFINFAQATFGGGAGPNGSGVLFTITFTGVAYGTSDLIFDTFQITDTQGTVIPTTAEPGQIIVEPDCDPEIGISNLNPDPLTWSLNPNETASGTFTVSNLCATLNVTSITCPATWVTSISPSTFSLDAGQSQVVTVNIGNLIGECGTLTDDITINSNAVNDPDYELPVQVNLPDCPGIDVYAPHLTDVEPGSSISVPIYTDDLIELAHAVESYQFSLQINSPDSILSYTGYTTTGTLSDGWSIGANVVNNVLQVFAFTGAGFMQGTGNIILLNFDVIGTYNQTTDLEFIDFMFNEGIPDDFTHDGSVSTKVGWSVKGNINYYYPNYMPVPGAQLQLAPGGNSDESELDGYYEIINVTPGSYTLSASKSNDVNGAITAYDASRVLQCLLVPGQCSADQEFCADVTGNGE